MSATPLFTLAELTAAFRLILPEAEAQSLATRWFERFAGDDGVDEAGYFLYEDPAYLVESSDDNPEILVSHVSDDASREASVSDWFHRMSMEEKECLLLGLSDFHLNLVALVSEPLFRRIQGIYRDSDPNAERRRRQTQRLIEGWLTK